ncbi:MAG: peroxiredoxin [Acidimicrobiaceae bacterium]|nr:peroxiredoxin [Acidimicrobiaceae bacterium]
MHDRFVGSCEQGTLISPEQSARSHRQIDDRNLSTKQKCLKRGWTRERLPDLELDAVGRGRIVLPDDLSGSVGVIVAYRGSWCPCCNAHLASFQRHLPTLTEEGVSFVALSTDDEEHAASTVAQHRLTFPVGYGADAEKTAELLKGVPEPSAAPSRRRISCYGPMERSRSPFTLRGCSDDWSPTMLSVTSGI